MAITCEDCKEECDREEMCEVCGFCLKCCQCEEDFADDQGVIYDDDVQFVEDLGDA